MAKFKKKTSRSYGLSAPLVKVFPDPIISTRNPTTADFAEYGQVWVNQNSNTTFVCTSRAGGLTNWEQSSGNEIQPPLEIGNSTTREGADATDWTTTEHNILQVYCNDAAATGANYRKAGRFDMTVSSGDGTDSPQALRANMVALSGSHHEEIYGFYSWANQDDGSEIDSNMIGILGASYMEETDAADAPAQWTYGIQGIIMASATAVAPGGSSVMAGIASYVCYDAAFNNAGHGYVASRNGGGAGGTAGAAFKVVGASNIINDWDYGLDLVTGSTGAGILYGTADIRLANGLTIDSLSAVNTQASVPDTGIVSFVGTDTLETVLVTNDVDTTIADEVEASRSWLSIQSTASVLQATGIMGKCTQGDGSAITSTASGIEGWLNLLETDNADLPPNYAFGVKGYLDAADTTGVPAGICAGVGSIVEYNTPFNAKAYGMAVSRLDAGGGAGTAGQAAFGVVQGTVAAADWLYGLDFSAATNGFTTADIIFQNSSTLAVDTEGVLFSGDVEARNLTPTNTKMVIHQSPLMTTKANTGNAPTGGTGDENLMIMQEGVIMEQHLLGAAQTIIAPRMDATGLLISLDLTNDEGAEYGFGILGNTKHAFTIGTSAAFFFKCKIKIADATGADPVYIGFRKIEDYQAAFTSYTDFALIGVEETQNSELITIADRLNTGAITYTNTTDAWTDGQTKTLTVNVSAAGVTTYLIDGVAPTATHAHTFDNGDVVVPCLYFLHGAAAPGAIHLIEMYCGYQDWT